MDAHVQLPIDPLLPEILAHLRRARTLVLEAPPGAGKTTRVPPALLALDDREVLVLEPRRLAARLAARYVAAARREKLGETVGYQVRFEEVAGPRTRLRFLTEGVLTRRLLSDPLLERAGTVVLDEFHERHLEGDLALALLCRLPHLRLVVMSATLNTAAVARYLGGSAVLTCRGRQHPLSIEYTPHSAVPLEEQVAAALERLGDPTGHTLVFLPGAAEIRRAFLQCEPIARRRGLLLLSLHGDQPPEEQDRAVAPSDRRKVILSTNVAESSVTIEGVTAVIDSGLARVASYSPWSGLPALHVARISQASADQRAGRAGRTAPGRVIRLYPREDFGRRPAADVPEILRADLSPVALQLRVMGIRKLEWLDAPPAAALEHADQLLRDLGADQLAGEMARYPLHPRLARLAIEAIRRGAGEDGCAIAALLSAGARSPNPDLLALLDSEWDPQTRRILRQLSPPRQRGHDEKQLRMSILTAFPDRVARRRQGNELQLASGGSARLSGEFRGEFLVAVEIEDRREQKLPLVRLASAIEPEWLLDLYPHRVRERSEVTWNRAAERVEAVSALLFDGVVIEESRGAADPAAAERLLAEKALEAGIEKFADTNDFLARVDFAAVARPDMAAAVAQAAQGLRSFAELKQVDLVRALERQLAPAARRQLEEMAPARIRLPGGRHTAVHYEPGQPPWIASRLQDFFGMRETPRVAAGKVPVVVRLLAPNQRPVQMTTDLAGFWERLYPEVRRELSRRYPRHHWPEDPLNPRRSR